VREKDVRVFGECWRFYC